MFIVYTRDGKERCVLKEIECIGKYMNERVVTATLFSNIPIPFDVGDYLNYRGEKFSLSITPTAKKTGREQYTYTLNFYSQADELKYCVFRDLVPYDNKLIYANHKQVDFTGDITYLTDRIQANLDAIHPGKWTIHVSNNVDLDNIQNVSLQNENCWNALTLVNSVFDEVFYVKGNEIFVGYTEPVIEEPFIYGKGNGIYDIERVIGENDKVITKLCVTGTDRNLDSTYPKQPYWSDSNLDKDFFLWPLTLMIPEFKKDGKTDYILASDEMIAKYGIREGAVEVTDVYPSITGAKNSSGDPIDEIIEVKDISDTSNIFEVAINNPRFTDSSGKIVPLRELMIPSKSKMVMKSGGLQGFGFFIKQAIEDGDKVRLILERNKEEGKVAGTTEDFIVPNKSIPILPGDKFVFIEIFMPQEYIREAEIRLREKGVEYLEKQLKPNYTYNITINDIYMHEKGFYDKLYEGQKLRIKDDGLGVDDVITIETLSIKEGDNLIPSYQITLNNDTKATTLQGMSSEISQAVSFLKSNFSYIDRFTNLYNKGILPNLSTPGELGKLFYSAGVYEEDVEYSKKNYSVPYVLYRDSDSDEYDRYILTSENPIIGVNPKEDYDSGGGNWDKMDKFLAIYTSVLLSDYAKLGSFIFSKDHFISQWGYDKYGNQSNNYELFDPDGDEWFPNFAVDAYSGVIKVNRGDVGMFTIQGSDLVGINEQGKPIIKFTTDKIDDIPSIQVIDKIEFTSFGGPFLFSKEDTGGGLAVTVEEFVDRVNIPALDSPVRLYDLDEHLPYDIQWFNSDDEDPNYGSTTNIKSGSLSLNILNISDEDGSVIDFEYIYKDDKLYGVEFRSKEPGYYTITAEVRATIIVPSKGFSTNVVLADIGFRNVRYEIGQAPNTVLASDGILSSYRSDDYFKFKSGSGFETVSGNYGLKVSPNGLYRLKNGEWEIL